jgi:chromosome segregation ATPase
MDQVFTGKFWQDQWGVVMSAPWLILPLLVIAGSIGWRWKASNDDGEIRGFSAQKDAAEARLLLAHDQNERVAAQVREFETKVTAQNKVIAELQDALSRAREKLDEVTRGRVEALARSNTEIRNSLTNLSTSTADLMTTLTILDPKGRLVVPSRSATGKSE